MAASRPRQEEQVFFHDVLAQQQQQQQNGGFPGGTEAWMDGLLDYSDAAEDAPVDWDEVDNFLANANPNNDGLCLHPDDQDLSLANLDNVCWPSNGHSLPPANATTVTDPSTFPSLHLDAQQHSVPSPFPVQAPFLDQGLPPNQLGPGESTVNTLPDFTSVNVDPSQLAFDQVAAAFKELARARAAADPRPLSRKQKQRDASIALYLQKLRDTCNQAVAILDSDDTPQQHPPQQQQCPQSAPFDPADAVMSSPDFILSQADMDQLLMSWQPSSASTTDRSSSSFENSRLSGNTSPRSSPESYTEPSLLSSYSDSSGTPAPAERQAANSAPANGGVELVMDMNMNTATTLPRKHRPRTQAQRERYLAVRNQGACEKHKKQHKRCTCIDNAMDTKPIEEDQAAIRRSRAQRHTPPRRSDTLATAAETPSSGVLRVVDRQQAEYRPHDLISAGNDQGDVAGDSEQLRWQLLQSLDDSEQQQHNFVRTEPSRLYRDPGFSRSIPQFARSPAANDVQNPATSNSEVTWDLKAVSHHEGVEKRQDVRQEIRLDKSPAVLSSHGLDTSGSYSSGDADYGRLPVTPRQYIGDPLLSSIRQNQPCTVMSLSTARHAPRQSHHARYPGVMNATGGRSVVHTGSLPHHTSSSSSTNDSSRQCIGFRGRVDDQPSRRYDISHVSSAHHEPQSTSDSSTGVYFSTSNAATVESASTILSVVSSTLCTAGCETPHRLRSYLHAILLAQEKRSDSSSFRLWFMIWSCLLLFSVVLR